LPKLLDCGGVAAVIDGILEKGDAILFAATSDGGAVVIQLLNGLEKPKAYCVDSEQLADSVAWLAARYLGTPETGASSADVVGSPHPPTQARTGATEARKAAIRDELAAAQLSYLEAEHTT